MLIKKQGYMYFKEPNVINIQIKIHEEMHAQ